MVTKENARPEEQAQIANPSIWSRGKRQMIAPVPGIALYAILYSIFNILQLPNAAGGVLVLRPENVVPLFFGVTFGPLVGFLVGGIGNVIGDLLSYHSFSWNWELGTALIGMVAGMVGFFTSGRFRTVRALVCVGIACVLAIVLGAGFSALSDIWVSQIDISAAINEFTYASVPAMINGLIPLLLLLLAYNTVEKQFRVFWRLFRTSIRAVIGHVLARG